MHNTISGKNKVNGIIFDNKNINTHINKPESVELQTHATANI